MAPNLASAGVLLLVTTALGLRPGFLRPQKSNAIHSDGLGLMPSETPILPRRELLLAASAAVSSLGFSWEAVAAGPTKIAKRALQPELVQILRVKESCSQETRLIKTGKYKDLQRLSIKRAIGMMIDNSDLQSRFVSASAYADLSQLATATAYGNTAVESLIQILEYFPDKLVVNDLSNEQKSFVLAALDSCSKNIDRFIALMPEAEVKAAVKQIEEENALNLKEFEEAEPGQAYLNAPANS